MQIEQADSPEALKSLIAAARAHLETNEPQAAVEALRAGAGAFGKNEKFCFELGYALYEAGLFAEAAVQLKASIKLAPAVRPQKYFTLAQISDDKAAGQLYRTGLSVAEAKLAQLAASGLAGPALAGRRREVQRPMAQARCALAQLEEKKLETGKQAQFSEAEFLGHLSAAAEVYPGFLETYFLGAMYYFNCQNEALFRQAVAALVGQIAALEAAEDDELDEWGPDFFLPLVRLLIECQMWVEAGKLAEAGLANDSSSLEATYLYAFSLFYQDKFAEAEDALDRLEELKVRESGDQELLDGFLELRGEVAARRAAEGPEGEGEGEGAEDWASDDQEDGRL